MPFEALIQCVNDQEVLCLSLYSSALTSDYFSISPINLVIDPDMWAGRTEFEPEIIISKALETIDSLN